MLQFIERAYNAYQSRRLQEKAYLARVTEKYMQYVAGPENLARLIDAQLFDSKVKPTNHSTGYYDQEQRYANHIWVYACVNVIAEKSSVPKLLLQNNEMETMDTPLPKQPNSDMTWDECEQLIAMWLELTGNAYLYHDKEEDTFWPLKPSRMKICCGGERNSIIGYAYNNADKGPRGVRQPKFTKSNWMYDNPDVLFATKKEFQKKYAKYHGWATKGQLDMRYNLKSDDYIPFEPEEILHFKFIQPTHDHYGLAPLCALMTNLQTDLFAREWNLNFFENGAVPPGMLLIPQLLPPEEFRKIEKQFHDKYTGTKNRGKTVVLQGGSEGATYTPFPGTQSDFEFLEGQVRNRDEVLAVFCVPHVMVHASMNPSHSSVNSVGIKEEIRLFWQGTIKPKQKMKAAVWTKHFEADIAEGYEFAYDYSDIEELKPDYTDKAKTVKQLMSVMTIEEIREKHLGLTPEWEGVLLLPANLQPYRYTPQGAELVEIPHDDMLMAADDD